MLVRFGGFGLKVRPYGFLGLTTFFLLLAYVGIITLDRSPHYSNCHRHTNLSTFLNAKKSVIIPAYRQAGVLAEGDPCHPCAEKKCEVWSAECET
jgi:hypothetical protein